jgi:uncharacterized protein
MLSFVRSRGLLALATLGLVLVLGGLAQAAPLRALMLTGQNNHDWRSTTPFLHDQLEATGRFSVDVTEDPSRLTLADFSAYDVLIDNYFGDAWSAETNQAFLDYVAAGGGVVIIHAADNAFPGWTDFESLIGIAWRDGSGHGTRHRYVVTIDDPEHPILRGVPHFLHTADELYHKLVVSPNTTACTIASAYSRPEEGGTGNYEPMLLVNEWGKGRMFHTAMGHDNVSFGDPYHALILARGAEWAATGRVTIPVPADLPTDDLTSDPDPAAQQAKWVALGLGPSAADDISRAGSPAALANELSRAIEGGNEACRVSARQRVVRLGLDSVPELLALRDDDDLRPAAQTDLLLVAGMASRDRESAKALAAAIAPLLPEASDVVTRRLAVRMLGQAGSSGSVDLLAKLLDDEEVGSDAARALARIPGVLATSALSECLRQAPAGRQRVLLDLLAERGDPGMVKAIAEVARTANPAIAAHAARTLGSIRGDAALQALAGLLVVEEPLVKTCAAIGLVDQARSLADAGRSADALAVLKTVLASPPSDADAALAVRTLPLVGGAEAEGLLLGYATAGPLRVRVAATQGLGRVASEEALAILLAQVDSEEEAIVWAALSGLGAKPAPQAVAKLLAVARDENRAPDVREAASAALARHCAALAGTDKPAAAEIAWALYERAATPEQRAETLHLAGNAGCARLAELFGEALRAKLADPTGEDLPALAHATVAVVDGLREAGAKVEEIESLCLLALDKVAVEPYASQLADRLQAIGSKVDLAALRGFLTDWRLVGPFPNVDGAASETAFLPEDKPDPTKPVEFEGATLQWQSVHTTDPTGRFDLRQLVQSADNLAAYAYTEVTASQDTDAVLKIGSDDGIVAWVNGEKVDAVNTSRALTVDQDVVTVHLKAGANTILLKVLQNGGDWGFCCRLVR